MKRVVQEFLTLDGVSQGPGSPDEDTSDGFERGGWFVPHLDEEFDRLVGTWLGEADAFLFGRRTYQNFARDWPKMTDHPFAGILNGLPKYVASHSLTKAEWNPTTILSGDIGAAGIGDNSLHVVQATYLWNFGDGQTSTAPVSASTLISSSFDRSFSSRRSTTRSP